MTQRLIEIDSSQYRFLSPDDECLHIGEYNSGGGYKASTTNQQRSNLKKRPNASPYELQYKRKAIKYWGDILIKVINWEYVLDKATFVAMPGSKTKSHELYDPRNELILDYIKSVHPDLDAKPILYQKSDRDPQHIGNSRLEPHEIQGMLGIDEDILCYGVKDNIILVDDVFTRGASFVAAKRALLERIKGVSVYGVFLAKTVWPVPDYSELLDEPPEFFK